MYLLYFLSLDVSQKIKFGIWTEGLEAQRVQSCVIGQFEIKDVKRGPFDIYT